MQKLLWNNEVLICVYVDNQGLILYILCVCVIYMFCVKSSYSMF